MKSFLHLLCHPVNLPAWLHSIYNSVGFTTTSIRLLKAKANRTISLSLLILIATGTSFAQNTGCVTGRFGIDGGLYSGIIEFGTGTEPSDGSVDWFTGDAGFGVIIEEQTLIDSLKNILLNQANPMYRAPQRTGIASIFEGKILIDALFARDEFGGTGQIDQTSYVQASKNGEDPAIWAPGPSNVLGKNDIVDTGGFMFRDGLTLLDDLWFVGLFNMAEPGGQSYMDFEFFVESVTYDQTQQQFSSGGPQLGHTAYNFDANGNITKIGDFIFSVSLLASGPVVETRLWVSRNDWQNIIPVNFDWAGTFDGAFNGSPYGYAGIRPKPNAPPEFCGQINTGSTLAPPWGTRNTKSNAYGTTYQELSIAEVAINLTAYGMDHASLLGTEECVFPLNTFIVKTRASASFTAQLKDFAGPYTWGSPTFIAQVIGEDLSCDNQLATIVAIPSQPTIQYDWSTVDGNVVAQFIDEPWKIQVDKPGTYEVIVTYQVECIAQQTVSAMVGYDDSAPFFNEPLVLNTTSSCSGSDGSVSLNVTGANGPYTYTWYQDGLPYTTEESIAPGNHTLGNLAPGTYTATIQGTGDCTAFIDAIEIKARTPLAYTPTLTHVTCFGLTNGKIELGPITGNGPLSYLWNTGATSKDLLNVGAGTYSVQIIDADGCVTEVPFVVNQPTQITATINKIDDTNPDLAIGNGTITLTPSGGTPFAGPPAFYSYSWSGPDGFTSNDKDLTGLKYGNYSVTITDANGCTFVTAVFIYEPEICFDGIDNDGDGLTDCDDPDCKPATPLGLTPSDPLPCVGEEVTYTVQLPVGVTYDNFVWLIPANTVITSTEPHTGQSITLYWTSTAGGQICSRGKIFDCLSAAVCNTVEVDDVPAPPTDIIIENN